VVLGASVERKGQEEQYRIRFETRMRMGYRLCSVHVQLTRRRLSSSSVAGHTHSGVAAVKELVAAAILRWLLVVGGSNGGGHSLWSYLLMEASLHSAQLHSCRSLQSTAPQACYCSTHTGALGSCAALSFHLQTPRKPQCDGQALCAEYVLQATVRTCCRETNKHLDNFLEGSQSLLGWVLFR
jgi:hypothetical protein